MMENNTMTIVSRTIIIVAIPPCSSRFGTRHTVYYGTASNSLNVSFIDTTLPVEAKTAITKDLQICLNDWGKATTLDLEGRKPGWIGYLDNPNKNSHYPSENKFPKQVISSENNELSLLIHKDLSDAYTNVFAFAAANSNIVAAAYQFASFVASPAFAHLPHNEMPNYILEKDTPAAEIIAEAAETIEELGEQTYYPPSLLGFIYLEPVLFVPNY